LSERRRKAGRRGATEKFDSSCAWNGPVGNRFGWGRSGFEAHQGLFTLLNRILARNANLLQYRIKRVAGAYAFYRSLITDECNSGQDHKHRNHNQHLHKREAARARRTSLGEGLTRSVLIVHHHLVPAVTSLKRPPFPGGVSVVTPSSQ